MKTIKEHLETLKEPYRTSAIQNATEQDPKALEIKTVGIKEAICKAFQWDKTKQGYHYWDRVYTITSEYKDYEKSN